MKFILVLHITCIVLNLSVRVHSNERTRRFVGGYPAGKGQFPYMASLRHLNTKEHFCGGSIIHQDIILTAAHCLEDKNLEEVFVAVGSISIETGGEYYFVNSFAIHPYYDGKISNNDIALIKLKRSIKFSRYVDMIHLHFGEPQIGVTMTISGWGDLSHEGQSSPILQYAQVISISLQECTGRMEEVIEKYNITNNDMCTYNGANVGFCDGDSGGPLVYNGSQVGIVSWTVDCAAGYPDVYVKVSAYTEWIEYAFFNLFYGK